MRRWAVGVVAVGCSSSEPVAPVPLVSLECPEVGMELGRGSILDDPLEPSADDGFVTMQGGRSDYWEFEASITSPWDEVGIEALLVVDEVGPITQSRTNFYALAGWLAPSCAGEATIRLTPEFGFVDCAIEGLAATLELSVMPVDDLDADPVLLSASGTIVFDEAIRDRCR